MRRVYVENLGCSKNQVDAEVMVAQLSGSFTLTDEPNEADLIIVNTCGFIESAREESVSAFFELHRANPEAKIIFSGCMAERYSAELEAQLSEASAIFGNRDLSKIGEVVAQIFDGSRVLETPPYGDVANDVYERNELFNFPGSAYLKISEGCNHRCSYCAIPLIRGSLRSRPMAQIIDEAKTLVARGVRELNLIAQDLASYGTDWSEGRSCFMDLLEALVALEGEFWIRLLYIHPDTFPPQLPAFIKANAKVLSYFDIPFQHADTTILRSMGRTGTKERHLALIEAIRAEIPQAVLRSTILLGYPGEDDQAFDEVIDFLRRANLDWVGSFVYSREEGTRAFDLRAEAEHKKAIGEAKRRQKRLQRIQGPITAARLERFVGTEMDVLVEELIEGEDLAIGRSWAQAPEVDGLIVIMGRDLEAGSIVRCGIRRVNGLDLEALLIEGGRDG